MAAGEPLSFAQKDITFTGHALECRINAEDPVTLRALARASSATSTCPAGPGVRVDTFAHEGCEISPYYDSLIAKLMTHGRDRAEAIARMRRCLEVMVVEGIQTNIPLHRRILEDPDFKAGRIDTRFMERFLPRPGRRSPPPPDVRAPAARLSSTRSSTPARSAGASAGAVARRWSRAGARLLQVRAKDARRPRAAASCAREVVAAAHARRRARHRERPRPTWRASPAPTACTWGRTTCRPRDVRAAAARAGARRPLHPRRRPGARRRPRARSTTWPSGPCSPPRSKARPDPVVGPRRRAPRRAAAHGAPAGRHRRHHARRTRAAVVAAGADGVAVISALMAARRSRARRFRALAAALQSRTVTAPARRARGPRAARAPPAGRGVAAAAPARRPCPASPTTSATSP